MLTRQRTPSHPAQWPEPTRGNDHIAGAQILNGALPLCSFNKRACAKTHHHLHIVDDRAEAVVGANLCKTQGVIARSREGDVQRHLIKAVGGRQNGHRRDDIARIIKDFDLEPLNTRIGIGGRAQRNIKGQLRGDRIVDAKALLHDRGLATMTIQFRHAVAGAATDVGRLIIRGFDIVARPMRSTAVKRAIQNQIVKRHETYLSRRAKLFMVTYW